MPPRFWEKVEGMMVNRILLGSCALLPLCWSVAAHAEDQAPPPAAEESPEPMATDIVVTARKRAESLQDVPVSITAVNSDLIEQYNIVKIDQVGALTPNVNMSYGSVLPTMFTAYIRSLGNRSGNISYSTPVAVSVDGVYYSTISGSLVDVFDVNQIEVLRGPQGTLQGRNAPGGAVNVTTRRPTGDLGMRWELSYARFDQLQARGAVDAPIVDGVLAAKVSGFYNHGGDFMNNLTLGIREGGGVNNYGGRLGLLFTPSSDLEAYLTIDYVRDSSSQPPNRPRPHAGSLGSVADGSFEPEPTVCTVFGFCTEYGKYETGADFVKHAYLKNVGTTLNVDWDLGPVALTSVTGYRHVRDNLKFDADALPVVANHFVDKPQDLKQFSQELRLASNGSGPLTYVFGLYALQFKYNFVQTLALGGPLAGMPPGTSFGRSRASADKTKSFAIFGQATYKITDQWSISGGARQTWDHKRLTATPSFPGPSQQFKTDFENLSVEAGTEFRFDDDRMAYFRFSQGYRAGGFNEGGAFPTINVYKPENVDSYEVGLKSQWFDRRLTFNLSAFHYDYSGLQIIVLEGTGNINRIVNTETTKIRGVELEAIVSPTDNFQLRGTLGYLHTRYPDQIVNLGAGPINLRNVQKDNAPKWTGFVNANYHIPLGSDDGGIDLSADVSYKSTFALNPNPTPITIQKSYALVNGSITYTTPDDKYSISLFGTNLTNKYYKIAGETGNNFFIWETVGRPRSYGVKMSAKF